MNRQERARVIASLTHNEIKQLRDRLAGTTASDTPSDAELRFAKSLFGGTDDDQDDDDQDEGTGEYSEQQRRWARELFADTEQDPVIAGLVAGKTMGRTTATKRGGTSRETFDFS